MPNHEDYARALAFQQKVNSARGKIPESSSGQLLDSETSDEWMQKVRRIDTIRRIVSNPNISRADRQKSLSIYGVADARIEDNGALVIFPMENSNANYGVAGDAVGYQSSYSLSDGSNHQYIIAKPEKGGVVAGGKEGNISLVDHELSHADRGLEGYDESIPWGDRPQERMAESDTLEKFKTRLKAQGVQYTPEMGYRYLHGDYDNATKNTSQAPVKNRPDVIPSNAPILNEQGMPTDQLQYARELENARSGKKGMFWREYYKKKIKQDSLGEHGVTADILRAKLAYGQ
jgi:hypothetical protein